jgi:hypothetical protein
MRLFFVFTVFLATLFSCSKTEGLSLEERACNTRSYYLYDEPIPMYEVFDEATVTFNDSLGEEEMRKELAGIKGIKTLRKLGTNALVKLNFAICEEATSFIKEVEKRKQVKSASLWLITRIGDKGLTDVFVVELKHDSLQNKLDELIELNKLTYLEKGPSLNFLKTTNLSKIDALHLANSFYETGHFAVSRPIFIIPNENTN